MHAAEHSDGDPDPGYDLIEPDDFLPPNPFPDDAQRLGFDRYSGGDAAWIALAASLDARKTSHRLLAIVLLIGFGTVAVAPVLTLLR